MGAWDKTIRILAAVIFLVLYFTQTVTGGWGILLLVVAIIFLGTSLMGSCPLYLPFGMSTRKKDDRKTASES